MQFVLCLRFKHYFSFIYMTFFTKTRIFIVQNEQKNTSIYQLLHLTKNKYEPWHYRYVGLTAAQQIFELDITLEEYVDMFYA